MEHANASPLCKGVMMRQYSITSITAVSPVGEAAVRCNKPLAQRVDILLQSPMRSAPSMAAGFMPMASST